mmetsp:Transcript_21266/g.23671  ORF Transcript_21266/g.23671 Transcript_21266/m.23671 type:complete len:102 (-) Transcript_21266:465-770(-)
MVMQKCLLKCSSSQRKLLCEQIVKDSLILSQDQYGNYIVQNIIQMNDFNQNQKMLKEFTTDLVGLCTTKFSSNVIEKCIENFDDITRNMLYKQLERHHVMK